MPPRFSLLRLIPQNLPHSSHYLLLSSLSFPFFSGVFIYHFFLTAPCSDSRKEKYPLQFLHFTSDFLLSYVSSYFTFILVIDSLMIIIVLKKLRVVAFGCLLLPSMLCCCFLDVEDLRELLLK